MDNRDKKEWPDGGVDGGFGDKDGPSCIELSDPVPNTIQSRLPQPQPTYTKEEKGRKDDRKEGKKSL